MMTSFYELSPVATRIFSHLAIGALETTPGYGAFFTSEYLSRRSFAAAIFEGDFRDADSAISRLCVDNAISALQCAGLDRQAESPSFAFRPSHETLARVREHYHMPSYVISDEFETFVIVSDSDYFWGVAARENLVSRIARENDALLLRQGDVDAYLKSSDAHNGRIGTMLNSYYEICSQGSLR